MAQDIKIVAQMDTASFRTVDNAIKSLITSVEKLSKSMEGVARSVAKIQTGNTQGGNASVQNISTGGPQGKKGGIIEAILGKDDNSTSRRTSEINQLTAALARLSATAGGVKGVPGGVSGAAGGGWASKAIWGIEERGGGGPEHLSFGPGGTTTVAPSGAPAHSVPRAGGGSGGLGGGGRFGTSGSLSGGATGLVYGATGGLEALASGNVSGFLGSTLGRMGIGGIAAYGAYKIVNAGTDYMSNLYGREQQFAINYPIEQEQARAATMSPFKQFGMAHHNWNLREMIGFERAIDSSGARNVINRQDLWKETVDTKLKLMTPMGKITAATSAVGPAAIDFVYNGSPNMGFMMGGAGSFSMPAPVKTVSDFQKLVLSKNEMLSNFAMDEMKLQLDLGPQQAANISELAQAKMAQANSAEEYMMSAFSGGGPLSRTRSLRAMGRSTANIRLKGGGEASAYEWLEASALEHGRDLGDMAAEYQRVALGIGRGYGKIFGGFGAISAGEAGFGNITEITRMAGMIGGSISGASSIERQINERGGLTGGRNGLDVAVSRDLFQNIAKTALDSGMYGINSLASVNRMVGTYVFAGGADSAGQQRNAYAYGLGAQLERSYTSGSRSPFDRASSWQDAIYGTGGTFNGSTIRLQEMGATDPRLLASIAYGNADVPFWAQGLVDKGSAKRYFESERKRSFATVVDEQWKDDHRRAPLLRQLRMSGNDPNNVIDQMLRGKKVASPEWFNAQWEAVELLGSMQGGNKVANAAKLSEDYLRTKTLDMPSGPGAHAPGPAGLEGIVEKNRAAYQKEVAREMAAKHGEVISDKRKDEIAKRFGLKDHIAAEMAAGGSDISQLSDNFVKAATDLAAAIKNKVPNGPNRSHPPKAPK